MPPASPEPEAEANEATAHGMWARLRRRVHGWSLRRRVGVASIAFATALAILITTVVVSLLAFINKGDEVVGRWMPAATLSQQVRTDILSQTIGLGGYALNGRPQLLALYHGYTAAQQVAATKLQVLLHDEPTALAALGALQQASEQWRVVIGDRIIKARAKGGPIDSALIADGRELARFSAIRDSSTQLIDAVDQLSAQAAAARSRAAKILIIALIGATVVIVAGSAMIWWGLHSWVLGPVDVLAARTRSVAEGDLMRVIEPTGALEFVELGTDVEWMRRRITDELARVEVARRELARSNSDLEQFAYVASHDLSEPLRKVANFCQLLQRQYSPQLDDKARQYIAFAVDGAKRMQNLINDLLTLSRVGRAGGLWIQVDLNEALNRALATLEENIAAAGATVQSSKLPIVSGDPALLTSLFANLIGNAVKYRGDDPPLIVVTVAGAAAGPNAEANGWEFSVADNGIGIEPEYAERIFAIFQRLHLREEYDGTGVGLAMCRRIVDYHGGRIWLDTSGTATPVGATFRFTLPTGGTG